MSLKIDGNEPSEAFLKYLVSLSIHDESGFLCDRIEISFADDGSLKIPRMGVKIGVSIGFDGNLSKMGSFFVDDVSLGSDGYMRVFGKGFDTLRDLKSTCSRMYEASNLKELIEKVGREFDLKVKASDDLSKIRLTNDGPLSENHGIFQHNESCIHFLTRICATHDATLKMQDDVILVVKKGLGKSISGKDFPDIDIRKGDVSDWRVSFMTRPRWGSVEAQVFDLSTASDLLVKVGSGEPKFRFKEVFDNETSARNACEAKLANSLRDSASLDFSMPGNPEIKAEKILNLRGFRIGVDGLWLIKAVSHRIAPRDGYISEISAEKIPDREEKK